MDSEKKILRLVSNKDTKEQVKPKNWLFESFDEDMQLADFVKQLDMENYSKRLLQLEYIVERFSKIFDIWNHPTENLKLDALTISMGTEVLANLGFDYLLIKQFAKAADYFELLVNEIEEPDYNEFDYVLGYLTCLAHLGDTKRIQSILDNFPELVDFPLYYLPYFYALFQKGELTLLDQQIMHLNMAAPELIDLMFMHYDLEKRLSKNEADIELLPISEEGKDFISSMMLYREFDLNLEIVYTYVLAKYRYEDNKRVNAVMKRNLFK